MKRRNLLKWLGLIPACIGLKIKALCPMKCDNMAIISSYIKGVPSGPPTATRISIMFFDKTQRMRAVEVCKS